MNHKNSPIPVSAQEGRENTFFRGIVGLAIGAAGILWVILNPGGIMNDGLQWTIFGVLLLYGGWKIGHATG